MRAKLLWLKVKWALQDLMTLCVTVECVRALLCVYIYFPLTAIAIWRPDQGLKPRLTGLLPLVYEAVHQSGFTVSLFIDEGIFPLFSFLVFIKIALSFSQSVTQSTNGYQETVGNTFKKSSLHFRNFTNEIYLWNETYNAYAFATMPLINVHANVSGNKCLNFCLGLYLHQCFVYASSKGSNESAHVPSLPANTVRTESSCTGPYSFIFHDSDLRRPWWDYINGCVSLARKRCMPLPRWSYDRGWVVRLCNRVKMAQQYLLCGTNR